MGSSLKQCALQQLFRIRIVWGTIKSHPELEVRQKQKPASCLPEGFPKSVENEGGNDVEGSHGYVTVVKAAE